MTAIVQAAVRAPKPFNRKRSMTDVPKPVVVGAGGRKVPRPKQPINSSEVCDRT